MSEPTWKLMPIEPFQTTQIVFRSWPDGRQESCLVTATAYLRWLEEGGQPLPAEENQ
jgi:hypothetical protein